MKKSWLVRRTPRALGGGQHIVGVCRENSDWGWMTSEWTLLGDVEVQASQQPMFHLLRLLFAQWTRRVGCKFDLTSGPGERHPPDLSFSMQSAFREKFLRLLYQKAHLRSESAHDNTPVRLAFSVRKGYYRREYAPVNQFVSCHSHFGPGSYKINDRPRK